MPLEHPLAGLLRTAATKIDTIETGTEKTGMTIEFTTGQIIHHLLRPGEEDLTEIEIVRITGRLVTTVGPEAAV